MKLFVSLTCTLALGGLVALSSAAAQDCTTLGEHVVIGVGGSASKPLLARVAADLRSLPTPIHLVYYSPGACFGITPYVDGTPVTGVAQYWDADGTEHNCNLPTLGVAPDFGMMGTAGTLCSGVTAIPSGIGDFAGPVTSWSVIVPAASSQTSIAAEALYFIYGFGPEGEVAPWDVAGEIYGRNATSAAQIALGLAIGVPAERFVCGNAASGLPCLDTRSNQGTVDALNASLSPENAIGFTSTEVADLNRATVRTLAYQHTDQSCGYWPDSTATGFDKRNVRDGHYFLWSAYHFYAPVDGAGDIIDADTAQVIGYFTGEVTAPPDVPILDLIIDNGNIPECAMNVWRDTDIGPLYSFQPEQPCGCYFEARTTGETDCTECDGDDDCTAVGPSSTCRHGYCEVI
jgi:hypothetical protein